MDFLWNKYPYTNFHELNLNWVLQTIKLMGEKIDNFINLNSIKYADPIEWNITTQYQENTVVIDNVNHIAYLSTRPAPAGVLLTDTDYWTPILDLSSFYAEIGDLTQLDTVSKDNLVNAINEIFNKVHQLELESLVTIDSYKLETDLDDTDAFERYFDDIRNDKKIGLFINRNCTISRKIDLPITKQFSVVGTYVGSTITYTGNDSIMFNAEDDSSVNPRINGIFMGVGFDTTNTLATAIKETGIYASYLIIDTCSFNNFAMAVDIERAWLLNISNCDIRNGVDGINVANSTACRIVNNKIRYCTGTAVKFVNLNGNGCAGSVVDNLVVDDCNEGVYIEKGYHINISNSYFECENDKKAIVYDDVANSVVSNCYLRSDNFIEVNKCDGLTFIGSYYIKLPDDNTGSPIKNLILMGQNYTYNSVANMQLHSNGVIPITTNNNVNIYNLFASNFPYTIYKDSMTLSPNVETTLLDSYFKVNFSLINYNACPEVYNFRIRVYIDGTVVFDKKSDSSDGSILSPTYKYERTGGGTVQRVKITITNEGASARTLDGFSLNYTHGYYLM